MARLKYGDKRDYPKIDLYERREGRWLYVSSTTWSRTCAEAKARYVQERRKQGSTIGPAVVSARRPR